MNSRPNPFNQVHERVKRGLRLADPRDSKVRRELMEINATLSQMVNIQRGNISDLEKLLKEHEHVSRCQEEVINSQEQVIADLEEKDAEYLEANHNLRTQISDLEKFHDEVVSRLQASEDENTFLRTKARKLESLVKKLQGDQTLN